MYTDTLGNPSQSFLAMPSVSLCILEEMVANSPDVTSGNCTFYSKSCNSFPLLLQENSQIIRVQYRIAKGCVSPETTHFLQF